MQIFDVQHQVRVLVAQALRLVVVVQVNQVENELGGELVDKLNADARAVKVFDRFDVMRPVGDDLGEFGNYFELRAAFYVRMWVQYGAHQAGAASLEASHKYHIRFGVLLKLVVAQFNF